MYKQLLERVMSDDVTFKDWEKFRAFCDAMNVTMYRPGILEEERIMRDDFVKAAFYVASKLSFEDIVKDVVLLLAHNETSHPERFD